MKKSMCIVYEVDSGLYINMTNRCSNRCTFCIRNNGDGAYGSDSLWLEREPTVGEVLEAIFARDLSRYKEIVFCGYGEPSYRLAEAREVALAVKARFPDTLVRINTNGHSDLIHGTDTAPLYKDAFDTVSISLNTPSSERYDELCLPKFGGAHGALIDFAGRVRSFVPHTVLSVVRQTLTEQELEECRRIARDAGVELKIRDYIPPEP